MGVAKTNKTWRCTLSHDIQIFNYHVGDNNIFSLTMLKIKINKRKLQSWNLD